MKDILLIIYIRSVGVKTVFPHTENTAYVWVPKNYHEHKNFMFQLIIFFFFFLSHILEREGDFSLMKYFWVISSLFARYYKINLSKTCHLRLAASESM